MKKLTLKREISPILYEIVSFVNSTVNSKNFESAAKHFIHKKVLSIQKGNDQDLKSTIKILDNFSFYDYSLYDRLNFTDSELLTYIFYLSNIKGELLYSLTNIEKGILEKQVSPPLSAYKYVGTNKTDITYSERSYGLLFE